MLIQLNDSLPLYKQVFDAFRIAILHGELAAGSKLPSSRKQAQELGVSRNIILIAYEQLIAEGYAEASQGSGTFVTRDLPDNPVRKAQTASRSEVNVPLSNYAQRAVTLNPGGTHLYSSSPRYDLRYGLSPLDETLLKQWKRHLARAAQNPPLNYSETAGHSGLRQIIADYLARNRGVHCQAKNIIITSGSQQALHLTAQALLEPKDAVLIEEPCYQGANQIFLAHDATLIRSTIDTEGMLVPGQEAKLAYTTPSHQFPTGAIMSLQRRLELLSWAKTHNAFILEDDYDSEYRYEGRPIAAIQGLDTDGRVIYIGTFSKTLFPALRLGFLVLPDNLIEVFKALKWLTDRHNSSLEQAALASFIAENHFERHLRRTRTQNAKNRQVLLEALANNFGKSIEIMGSNAGIHMVVWFKNFPHELEEVVRLKSLEADVGIYPISPYYQKKPERLGFLFGYASSSPEDIQESINRLANVLHQL